LTRLKYYYCDERLVNFCDHLFGWMLLYFSISRNYLGCSALAHVFSFACSLVQIAKIHRNSLVQNRMNLLVCINIVLD
jgi:hypothetical protein